MSGSRRREWLLYGGAGLAAAGAGVAGAWWRRGRETGPGELLDAAFWSARFEQPQGGELSMASFRGAPLLLNFWATWCPPCVEELPMIDRFAAQNRDSGIRVVGLAIDRADAVRKFLERTPVVFPVALAGGDGTRLVRQLGNTSGGLPFSLVLAADSRVVARKMGKLEPADLTAFRARLAG